MENVSLLADFSLEMTGRDMRQLAEASGTIPHGTRINVTFLAHEDPGMRLKAARVIKQSGFVPVPHISARRLRSRETLEEFLAALAADGVTDSVFVVAGDPASPLGPYQDSLSVIRSGLLERYGIRNVGFGGYPEGHPGIPATALWSALADKAAALARQRLSGVIITQFGFDIDPVLDWIEEVRDRGIDLPVRIGVPGPAGIKRLMSYARRFGVGTSAGIARKYGFSITNLMGTAGPDRFIQALADRYDPGRHGEVRLHFFTFGGLAATSEWIGTFRAADQGFAQPKRGSVQRARRKD
jgi:methylenetetrahydrofolate reductase (NADPH)